MGLSYEKADYHSPCDGCRVCSDFERCDSIGYQIQLAQLLPGAAVGIVSELYSGALSSVRSGQRGQSVVRRERSGKRYLGNCFLRKEQ